MDVLFLIVTFGSSRPAVWNATPGDTLTCIREWGNRNNVFAVAVQSDGNIVGHVPRHVLCICMLLYVEVE